MKKINFNKNWLFSLEDAQDAFTLFGFGKYSEATGAAKRFYDHSNWQRIDLPHDWALSLPKSLEANTLAGGRACSHYARFYTEGRTPLSEVRNIGWYRRSFDVPSDWIGKRVFIEFEAVFRDSIVWVNGVYIDRHTSGYTGFIYDITDHLCYGEENSVAVRVDSDQPEGWWYEGAGIYRNVFLHVAEPAYFEPNETVVISDTSGKVDATARLFNDTGSVFSHEIVWQVFDAGGALVCESRSDVCVEPYSSLEVHAQMKIDDPVLWELDSPHLYTLRIDAVDTTEVVFGVRDVAFDAERGFILNGKEIKMWGACVHQDFGGVGVALTDNLQKYKIQRLKEMGVNAYRSSHNPPSPALLRACDELGMLVMDEVRMFGTSPEALRQMRALVKRDRNHPCVVIWSIGNEEFSVHNRKLSFDLASKASRLLRELDDTRPITYGGCNGANFEGVNGAVEVRGINYIRNGQSADWIDNYHKEHPEQPIVGTEETSYVLSRGAAYTDFGSGILDCTGDVVMSWGSTPKGAVKFCAERPYFAGIYMWTGFDYRGEPNPFVYTNTSSSFGTIDLSGMEKPPFYYYRSWWTNEPTLKLAPHWNYCKGEIARITVYTNCESVRLILNGREIGEYKVEYLDDIRVDIPFEAGELLAIGTRDGCEYTDRLVTSGRAADLTVTEALACESEGDIGIAEIFAIDRKGAFCPLADGTVEVSVTGGEIVGVCNGDPADMSPEVPTYREESCLVRTFTCDNTVYSVPTKAPNERRCRLDYLVPRTECEGYRDDHCTVAKFEDTDRKITDKIYTTVLRGAKKYEYVEFERFSVMCDVYLNGKLIGTNSRSLRKTLDYMSRPYRFYCKFKDGDNLLEVRAHLEEDVSRPFSGYVKLGRAVAEPIFVNLHYGRARVFVKGVSPAKVKAKLLKNR